jgi:large subunit ribosomal protein L35e
VYNQQAKSKLREKIVSEGGNLPVELRQKRTRAIRRRLTSAQANARTLKQIKKDAHFPQRVYAVKA